MCIFVLAHRCVRAEMSAASRLAQCVKTMAKLRDKKSEERKKQQRRKRGEGNWRVMKKEKEILTDIGK